MKSFARITSISAFAILAGLAISTLAATGPAAASTQGVVPLQHHRLALIRGPHDGELLGDRPEIRPLKDNIQVAEDDPYWIYWGNVNYQF
jgi:hypothetical protein